MPTKLNRAGQQQQYVPAGNGDASGEYGNDKGGNKHFKSFNKPTESDNSFSNVNKQRLGNSLSTQAKSIEQPKPILKSPSNYDEWAESIMTQERVGNPPEEIETRVDKTPIAIINDKDIENAKREFKPETVDRAVNLLRKYEKSVDETARDLEGIADGMGGLMIGMGFRLKRLGSTSRKLESYVIEEHANGNTNFTLDDAVGKMRDVARFTMMFDEKNFESDVQKAMDQLQKQGYKMVRAKNTFTEGATYKGLNCNFIDKQGNVFELQFHVPQSMKIKEGIEADLNTKKVISNRKNITSHDIYETTRVIEDKMRENKATEEEKMLYDDLTKRNKQRWAEVPNYEFAFLK